MLLEIKYISRAGSPGKARLIMKNIIFMAKEIMESENGFVLQPGMIHVGDELVVDHIEVTHDGNHEMWGWHFVEGSWKRSMNIEQTLSSEGWDAVIEIADQAGWFDEV